MATKRSPIYLSLIFCFMMTVDSQTSTTSTNQHICSSIESVTKNYDCPNSTAFNIIDEHNKDNSTWKIDFKVFQEASITNSVELLREIQRRHANSIPCPYTRQMNVSKCCSNWTGSNCDQVATSNDTLTSNDNEPLPFATCVLWGLFHYRTFDNTQFEFIGSCNYKLSGTQSWQVNVRPIQCNNWKTCSKQLSMLFGPVNVTAVGSNVIVNGVTLNSTEGIIVSGVTIERRGNYTYLTYSDGVRIKWDEATVIDLTVDISFKGKVSGLCGDYDQNPRDDLTLFDGTISPSAAVFGNQWRLDKSCPEAPSLGEVCSDDDTQQIAIDACQILLNTSDVFGECLHVVNGEQYYNACVIDYCMTATTHPEQLGQAMCNSYTAFARDCTDNYIDINWRTASRCPKSCPNNMTYVECASNCPKTCQSLSQRISQSDACMSDCSAGCICPTGTVLDLGQNQKCVKPDGCTCYYRGNYYQPGDSIDINCNQCNCSSGSWQCSKVACPRTCTVMGNGHIDTYDGKTFTLISSCQYVLLEGTDVKSSEKLRVMYTNTQDISTNELVIVYYGNIVNIKGSQIVLNGQPGTQLPQKSNNLLIRQATSVLRSVEGPDFAIYFDGFRVYITLESSFINQTRGLCGTFNYITRDDYETPNGLIETNIISFADAYKTSQTCNTPLQTSSCSLFPASELVARSTCQNLLKDSVFTPCLSVLDPSFYIESCTADLCVDSASDYVSTYTCYHLATYAHECAERGIIIDWMSKPSLSNACHIAPYPYGQCSSPDGGSTSTSYSECVSACDYSCSDLDQKSSLNCENRCLPGCACPTNTYYNSKSLSCIRAEQCPCYDVSTESYVQPGQNLFRTCTNCTCLSGRFQCENPNCLSTMSCPGNQIYSNNASTCPKTCDNFISFSACNTYKPGCTCPPGQVLTHDGISCVSVDECPCRYNQHSYATGEQILQSCNNCTCSGGIWTCTKMQCDSTCIATGDPHYITFDGLRYSYQGNCQYYLAKEKNNTFSILAENVPCGSTGVTCTKNIIIDYLGSSIDLQRGRSVIFNGIELKNYESIPKIYGQVSVFKSGVFTIISTPDFLIKWDESTRIYVTVYSQHRGNMEGLCGNYNDDSADDIKTAQGITGSIIEMANSWKTAPTCANLQENSIDNSDPCSNHEQRRDWATTECSLIRGKTIDNPFNPCIDLMDSTQLDMYYKECLYDACNCDRGGDCECLCTSLASFAEKCNSIGVPIRWRRPDRCPMQCDNNKVYMACGPICPEACSGKEYFGCELSGCVEGCFCSNGLLMDGTGTCVPISSCTCAYDNKYYPSGSNIIRGCEICSCTNGSFVCSTLTATECQQNCSFSEFQCLTSKECIPKTWKCDKTYDCADQTDENNCVYECSNKTSFTCQNGQCINMTYHCDGLPDCRDGSDEINCTYIQPCTEFLCKTSAKCIPNTWVCDGSIDCGYGDASDEAAYCKQEHCDLNSGRYFQCADSQDCLPISSKCDNYKDCLDGSDERNCACTCSEQFSCQIVCQCIDVSRVCDGIPDCIDQTDEKNCTCTSNEYTCLGGGCINRTQLCDGMAHCSKGDDETYMDCSVTTTTIIPSTIFTTIGQTSVTSVGAFISKTSETTSITSRAAYITGTTSSTCSAIVGAKWLSEYNLITMGDLDTNSDVEYRTLVCGSYLGTQSSNFAIHRDQNSIDPSLEIRYNISFGSTMNVTAGSVTNSFGTVQKISPTQYNLNGRLLGINAGNYGASAFIDTTLDTKCSKVTYDIQTFSQYLSQLLPNNDVLVPQSQPDTLKFIVNNTNADGLAIFHLSCDDVLKNKYVQQIEILNNVNATAIVINLSGQTCSYEEGKMVGSWLNGLDGRSRTLWNIYEKPSRQNVSLRITQNFMGALLAPFYAVETSANIDGSAAVYNMTARAQLQGPQLIFPTCVEPKPPTLYTMQTTTSSAAVPVFISDNFIDKHLSPENMTNILSTVSIKLILSFSAANALQKSSTQR
ncbi:unnamed protein product [Rotaria socialis]|uniref:VWFD domain-containing protein n=3 Tax=Rotaria socialis TaxID=392032 RepID=A0A820AI99_9BILA|nr:unnamed protein product [Rotaria socialis]CAF4370270.1 unnamed protein product [Rotaria socialis]